MSMAYKTLIQKRKYMNLWQQRNREQVRKKSREWYHRNKEVVLKKQKERNLANPEKRYLTNRKSDLKKYGITLEQYEEMEKKQRGLCAICGKSETNKYKKLAVDHCHKSEKVRGLLCSNCNQALGLFRDKKTLLTKAINYLQQI